VHPEVQQDQKPELRGAGEGDAIRTTHVSWDPASGRDRRCVSSVSCSKEWGQENSLMLLDLSSKRGSEGMD